MTEREKYEVWFAEKMEKLIDPSQRFITKEIMWEGWKGKSDSMLQDNAS